MNFLTTTLPLRAYLFTFAVFETAIIFVQNGFSVGNYSLNALSSHPFSLHKTYSVWGSESETYMSISPPLPLIFHVAAFPLAAQVAQRGKRPF